MGADEICAQAWALWNSLCGKALIAPQTQALTKMLNLEKNADYRLLLTPDSFSQLLRQQPQAQALKSRWQSHFLGKTLDSVQATAFINDLISILELVDQHFVALPVVSQSNLRQGEVGDAAVRRPAGKNSGWTLMLTVEGGGTFNCVRQSYASSPGDLVLLAPGALYDYRRTDDQPVWRHFWIYCNLSPAVVNSLNWQELGPYISQLHLRPQDNLVVQEIFQQLFDLDPSEKELPTALRNNLVEQIFLRSLQWAEDAGGHVINAHVKQAMNYIEQKLYDSIAVEDIAEAAGLSKARLSALFKNSLGRSMLSWRDERRMAQACQMLMNRAVKIHTVAQALGYDDALYFSRKFRQVVGKSPQAYRRKRL